MTKFEGIARRRSTWVIAALIVVVFVSGLLLGRGSHDHPAVAHDANTETEAVEDMIWTCSMHPQVRLPEPGQCPICGMDLIPLTTDQGSAAGSAAGSAPVLTLSARARKLAAVELEPVRREFVPVETRMVGKVTTDEARVKYITAWFPGRLERLFVDYTGVPVKQGDHLVQIYSPELLMAQQELISTARSGRELRGSSLAAVRDTAQLTLDASREKLRLWGLSPGQIDGILKRGTPMDRMTVYAPISGIVIHKNAVEGMYVTTGSQIYTIADLSEVWILLDAYESDLAWVRHGQEASFEVEAYPGRNYTGRIAFIDPLLNSQTRTVKVRLEVPNPDGSLKPGMFVRAVVRSRIAAHGQVLDPGMAGKWICSMHPGVIEDGPGSCKICGMPLVRAESLGYAPVSPVETEAPMIIPASAPLITGKRAVVYVAVPGEEGIYAGRDVRLGPRVGEHYIVEEGLAEGELVVTNGNFKIDSALQIRAERSVMSGEGAPAPPPAHDHGAAGGDEARAGRGTTVAAEGRFEVPNAFKQQIDRLLAAYYAVQGALSQDNVDSAKTAANQLADALAQTPDSALADAAQHVWSKEQKELRTIAAGLAQASDIQAAREQFALLSEVMFVITRRFPATGKLAVLRYHCPMAFENRGADWLQPRAGTENPYFGAAMFKCGSQVEVISEGESAPSESRGA